MNLLKFIRLLSVCILVWTAQTVFLTAQTTVPEYNELHLLRMMQAQQYEAAFNYLYPLYQADTTQLEMLAHLATAKRLNNDLIDAERYYRQVIARDSLHLSSLFQLGSIQMRRMQYEGAEHYLGRVLAIQPDHLQANILMSQVLQGKSDKDGAYFHLEKAHRLQPKNMDLAASLVELSIQNANYEQADTILINVLPLDPDNGTLLVLQANLYHSIKKYEELLIVCEHLQRLGITDKAVMKKYAVTLFNLGRHEASLEQYKLLQSENHENIGEFDFYYMAMAAKALGRIEEGISHADSLLSRAISPNTGYYYGVRGELLKLNNKPSRAIESYQRGLTFEPNPLHYYEMGLIYDRVMPHKSNAIRNYELFMKQEIPSEYSHFHTYVNQRLEELKKDSVKK